MLIQPDPTFCAELNYYKSFRSAYDRAFETGDYTAQTEKIGGAFDVTAAVREAVEYHAKNNYQTYVVLSGMSNMEQVKDNIQTFREAKPLSEEERIYRADGPVLVFERQAAKRLFRLPEL